MESSFLLVWIVIFYELGFLSLLIPLICRSTSIVLYNYRRVYLFIGVDEMYPKAILLDMDDTIIAFDHGIDLDSCWKSVCEASSVKR